MSSVKTSPAERGVYTMTFRDATGNMIAVAVSSDGRRLAELPFTASTRDQAETTLRLVLDRLDPERRLTVVKGG